MGRKGFLAVFVMVLLTAGSSLAQTGGQGVPGQRRRPARDEAGRMVDAYVVSNLQESLDLTDEQFVKVLPNVKRLLDDRRRLFGERRRMLLGIREDLGSATVDEKRVAGLVQELKRIEGETAETQRKNLEAVDAALTPVQQARFRILELEVEQRIREMVRERRPQGPSNRKTLPRQEE